MKNAFVGSGARLKTLLALSLALPSQSIAQADFTDQFVTGDTVAVELFATVPNRSDGETARLNAVVPSGDRLFAVESYDGLIYEITNGETLLWFDVATAIGSVFNNSDRVEGGLRSVAFHPEFQLNGKFYTSQDQDRLEDPTQGDYLSDVSDPVSTDSVVTEWTLSSDGLTASRELIRIGQPGIHSIKQITFNTYALPGAEDYGLLYIAHGDGESVEAGYEPHRNSALGKILRVDPRPASQKAYTVPVSNPFIADPAVPDEVYALGFRNPHNLSFSQAGLLFVADIGSGNVEEINMVVSGGNYGWGAREGAFTFLNPTRGSGVAALPDNDPTNGYIYPAASFRHEVTHAGGLAVAGGYSIENGSALQGRYVFGEFGSTGEFLYSELADMQTAVTSGNPSTLRGAIVYRSDILFDHDNNSSTQPLLRNSVLDVINDSPLYNAQSNRADLRFGRGANGAIYISSKQNNSIYLVTSSVVTLVSPVTVCVDIDGDGWGWDGSQSCLADSIGVESVANACVDSDGDGWGWNGVTSCRTQATSIPPEICIDVDGDGWGWNGVSSCRTESTPVENNSDCIDTDGDGWGWNGLTSCTIAN